MKLQGQVALVTGASQGIGEAVARRLAMEGARVVVTARRRDKVAEVAAAIVADGGEAVYKKVDVTDAAAVADAVAFAVETYGRLDVLVNNAGTIDPIARLADGSPDAWGRSVDVNVKGVYHGLRAALPVMLERGSGVIVNMSSGAATSALEGWSHYCAGKAAARMLTQCAHREVGSQGIRVVGLSPGTVATPMMAAIRESGVNPVSQLDWDVHAPVDWPARAVVFLIGPGGEPFAGSDFSIKTEEGRRLVGLVSVPMKPS